MNIKSLKTVVGPILQKHQVVRAGLFGSFARNEATEDSDVDLLVQFAPCARDVSVHGFKI